MDNIQEFILSHLPAQWLNTLTTHTSTYWHIYQTALYVRSIFLSLFNPLLHRLQTSPDIASFLLLALLLWVSYQFLNMARRAVVFWVHTTIRMAFWAAIASLGMWVWSRGFDGAVEDLNGWGQVWGREYQKWKEWEGDGGRGGGGGSGKGRSGWR